VAVGSAATALPVARLIDEFAKLPGIGPKTASRLAYHVLRGSGDEAKSVCFNTTEVDPCPICSDPGRDAAICVVEEPLDVVALERTGQFKGRYHVLHGAVSPVEGIGPEKLRIQELLVRVRNEQPDEIIVATNLDLPGEATATYLHRLLVPLGVNVTRPASGLPVGGDLEYADEVTLGRALAGRRAL
jgi:recombination protein RecR